MNPIKIVGLSTTDKNGNEVVISDRKEILAFLKNEADQNGDEVYLDSNGKHYLIDELDRLEVEVEGFEPFEVEAE